MSNKLKLYNNTTDKLLEESLLDNLSIEHNSIQQFISSQKEHNYELLNLAKEYQNKLVEINRTRGSINNIKYAKDNLLCRVIELCEPPFYLKPDMFNYKALVLYFMRNFRENTVVKISEINFKITVVTNINNLFHLIDIQNKHIRSEKIHERMIYDILEFGSYTRKKQLFESKVASLAWLKQTILKPDFIYEEDTILAKKLKFDLLFVRECGAGTKSRPYMYHLVGLKAIGNPKYKKYVIVSQFPIEKDREYSNGNNKISSLHNYVQCNRPFFKREGVELPKYSNEKVKDENASVNRLMNKFGG